MIVNDWKSMLSHPTHPIWSIMRTISVTACAGIILYITASSFDTTELKAVGGIGMATAVIEIIKRQLTKS